MNAVTRAARALAPRVTPRLGVALSLALLGLALGHEQPEDAVADFVMTDWMLLTAFFGFMIPALLVTFIAWRRGHFNDIEGEVKTFWLTPEADFETPPWAWEEVPAWASERSRARGQGADRQQP